VIGNNEELAEYLFAGARSTRAMINLHRDSSCRAPVAMALSQRAAAGQRTASADLGA
jgi:hypothetical protein